jgi:hypothetical protein
MAEKHEDTANISPPGGGVSMLNRPKIPSRRDVMFIASSIFCIIFNPFGIILSNLYFIRRHLFLFIVCII